MHGRLQGGWRMICLCLFSMAGTALPEDGAVIALGDFSQDTKKWQLSLGAEFPGAQGTLELEADPEDAQKKNLRLTADFTGGGRYVGIGRQFAAPLDIRELRFTLQTGGTNFAIRLTDNQGQTFQQYIKLERGQSGWREIRIREFGNPARKDIFYWGGAKDGVWRGPAKSIMILLEVRKEQPVNTMLFRELAALVEGQSPQLLLQNAPLACYLTPGQPATLTWKSDLPARSCPAAALHYEVLDYQGGRVQEGQAAADTGEAPGEGAGQMATTTLTLPAGYFELVFPKAGGQSFGVVCLPAHTGGRDPFFCMDAAFGCFPQGSNKELRNRYYAVMARCGIGVLRERFFGWSLKGVEDTGHITWKPEQTALRGEVRAHGLQTLENFTVAEQKKPNPYPLDLLKVAGVWPDFVGGTGGAAVGIEIWNEPDIFASGMVPGDLYTALQRAIAYANDRLTPRAAICGGVFNHVKKPVFDTYALNGFFANADVFAYHDYYLEPEKCEWLIGQYRAWAAAGDAPAIPFWMTEAGSGWTRGPTRPPLNESAKSALDIAFKAVECRACGNRRHFPFLLGYYDEGKVNWGMHAKDETPLRSIAAYAACVRALSNKRYLGDWKDAPVFRARVFAADNDPEAVVVLSSGKVAPGATIRLPAPATRVEGADGRALAPGQNGEVPLPDGVGYAYLPLSAVKPWLNPDTEAMKLTRQAAGAFQRAPSSPLVLQPVLNPDAAGSSPKGYSPRNPADVTMTARLCNLSDQEQPYELVLQAPPGVTAIDGSAKQSGTIAPRSAKPLLWRLNLEAAMRAPKGDLDVKIINRRDENCFWGMRFLRTEILSAHRVIAPDAWPAPETALSEQNWTLLGEDAYVPLGFVIYDRKTKVRARCSWSAQQLQLDVLVEKPGFHQSWSGENTWLGDSIQFALQYPGLPNQKEGMDFYEFAAALTAQGPQVYRHRSAQPGQKPGLATDLPCRITRESDRVLYSLRLPMQALGYPELQKGAQLRFSLLVNYNDGLSRAGYFHLGDGIAAAKSPAEYCVLKLEE